MKRRAVVTGLGVVTPLGRRLDTVWERLVGGESGIGPISLFDVAGYRVQFGGQVPWVAENEDIANPKELKRLDRFTQFALAAAKDAVSDSGIDFASEDPYPWRDTSELVGLGPARQAPKRIFLAETSGSRSVQRRIAPALRAAEAEGYRCYRRLRELNHLRLYACER